MGRPTPGLVEILLGARYKSREIDPHFPEVGKAEAAMDRYFKAF